MSQASVWMTWTAASELWPQQALIRASSRALALLAHSLASATSAQQAASSRRSSERLPSEHARASDACECRETAGAYLHKHMCRGCTWRSCMPQCPSAGDSRPSRAHAAHLMAVLSSPWVVCPQTFKSRKAGPGLSPPCGQHDHLRHAVAKIGPSFSPRPDHPTPVILKG